MCPATPTEPWVTARDPVGVCYTAVTCAMCEPMRQAKWMSPRC